MLESLLVGAALTLAVLFRPWRPLPGVELLSPTLALLAVLPWLWALPSLYPGSLQLQLSGAPLAVMLLGWPRAVLVLVTGGAIAALASPLAVSESIVLTAWLGVLPASLALGMGVAIRRWLGHHPFLYILGRAFLVTLLSLFASSLIAEAWGQRPAHTDVELARVGRWLMAWADAFLTGLFCAVFVAFRPQWLATWSDRLYLGGPGPAPKRL